MWLASKADARSRASDTAPYDSWSPAQRASTILGAFCYSASVAVLAICAARYFISRIRRRALRNVVAITSTAVILAGWYDFLWGAMVPESRSPHAQGLRAGFTSACILAPLILLLWDIAPSWRRK